jgi:hypothetical protein
LLLTFNLLKIKKAPGTGNNSQLKPKKRKYPVQNRAGKASGRAPA